MIKYRRAAGVVTLTLTNANRPNVLSVTLQREILAHLHALAADSTVRALTIDAEGPAFCVGADISELQTGGQDQTRGEWLAKSMTELTNPIVHALQDFPAPVLCAMQGAAAGAGVGLALAADVLVMARPAYLYLPFVPRLGLIPDMGASWFLPRRIGITRALGATLLGHRITAEQALQWGLAWSVVEADQLALATAVLAEQLARTPPGAALEARRVLTAGAMNTLSEQLTLECARQQVLIGKPAFEEGVQAFLDKREPRFWLEKNPVTRSG